MIRGKDGIYHPQKHDPFVTLTVDGRDYHDTIRDGPRQNDCQTVFTVRSATDGATRFIRWDLARGQFVRALGQDDGAPVVEPWAVAEAPEIPPAVHAPHMENIAR